MNSIISNIKYQQTILFICFAICVFLQCVIFHYYAYQSLLVSSIITNPWSFWAFYLPKLAISIFIACPVFLFKNNTWIVICSLLINIWIEANLIYFRSNGYVIDAFAFSMTNNMHGFWNSILIYIKLKDAILLLITAILWVILFIAQRKNSTSRQWLNALIAILLSVGLQILGQYGLYKSQALDKIDWPFYVNQVTLSGRKKVFTVNQLPVQEHSILHLIIWDCFDAWQISNYRYAMTNDEIKRVDIFINKDSCVERHNEKLIIILIESLENWVIQPEWMPNLYKLAHESNLYCHRIKSQIRQGTSADGQMIINTGLLPIQNGATCFLFPKNQYPSLISLTNDSNIIILPHDVSVWNQHYMNIVYGINNYLCCSPEDSSLFETMQRQVYNGTNGILLLTMSTHPPFHDGDMSIELPIEMPENMKNYIRCCKKLDNGMAEWINDVMRNPIYQSYTIVITGDHAILSQFRDEQIEFCKSNREDLLDGIGYCPLIINTPNIKHNNIETNEIFYQMDIYPTILEALNVKDYWWKGFGINIFNYPYEFRKISEKEAYELSDKIIRSNYFSSLKYINP